MCVSIHVHACACRNLCQHLQDFRFFSHYLHQLLFLLFSHLLTTNTLQLCFLRGGLFLSEIKDNGRNNIVCISIFIYMWNFSSDFYQVQNKNISQHFLKCSRLDFITLILIILAIIIVLNLIQTFTFKLVSFALFLFAYCIIKSLLHHILCMQKSTLLLH